LSTGGFAVIETDGNAVEEQAMIGDVIGQYCFVRFGCRRRDKRMVAVLALRTFNPRRAGVTVIFPPVVTTRMRVAYFTPPPPCPSFNWPVMSSSLSAVPSVLKRSGRSRLMSKVNEAGLSAVRRITPTWSGALVKYRR
jgi:hypothetical protein